MDAGKSMFAIKVAVWITTAFIICQTDAAGQNPSIKLYYATPSPPCRSVMVMLKLLNLSHELIPVDLSQREAHIPEFFKLNPQGSIPILVDDGFVVLDSHAINGYLVHKYANNDALYPKEAKARSVVDHRLHLDTGVLFPAYRDVVAGHLSKVQTGLTREIVDIYEKNYRIVEEFLKGNQFIAGDEFTIADISVFITLSSMEIVWPPSPDKFPLLVAYLQKCQTAVPPLVEINEPGIAAAKAMIFKGFNFNLS